MTAEGDKHGSGSNNELRPTGPFSDEERAALRKLVDKADEIIEVSENYKNAGWLLRFMFQLAKWISAITGGVLAWQVINNHGGLPK
jgi:hypothetical protein